MIIMSVMFVICILSEEPNCFIIIVIIFFLNVWTRKSRRQYKRNEKYQVFWTPLKQ